MSGRLYWALRSGHIAIVPDAKDLVFERCAGMPDSRQRALMYQHRKSDAVYVLTCK